jgi:3-dehydroquinate synthase
MSELLFIYGPPGSGKSSLGQLLAQGLGLSFYDLDGEIEAHSGRSIPRIFSEEGESSFRQRERVELDRLIKAEENCIIALGGGALTDAATRLMVENSGPVLLLGAAPEILHRRLQSDPAHPRPLLAGDTARQLESLLARRSGHYASFPLRLDTTSLDLEQAAWNAQVLLGKFHIRGMGQPYDVRVSAGGLDWVGEMLAARGLRGPVVLVSDETVGALYAARVANSLESAGYPSRTVLIPPGESQKTHPTIVRLWESFLAAGLERGSTVIALGGGVVGDLTGFAAATWMRGISWVYLPTTLLAMADASLGGKTGIDLPQGKNLVGAFHPPRLVLADPDVLASLPEVELRSGLAEVVKHGIIGDPLLFEWLTASKRLPIADIVRRSMAVKVGIIQADPFEKGQRAALNLGHTVGHAVELVSDYRLRHGEAVAVGLVAEARLAEGIGLAEHRLADTIAAALRNLNLPTEIPASFECKSILEALYRDKKRQNGKILFSLPVSVGEVKTGIVIEDLEEALCQLY